MGCLRLSAGAVACTALLLAACGDDGPEYVSAGPVVRAAHETAEAGSAKVETRVAWTTPSGRHIEMAGDGAVDIAGGRGRLTLDLSKVPGGKGELEEVFDGPVVWMRIPTLQNELPDTKDWIRVDAGQSDENGGDISGFPQAATDPAKALAYLQTADQVEDQGEEEVRGVPTKHYRARVEVAEPDLAELLSRAEPVSEVWIDRRDVVRRIRMQMVLQVPSVGPLQMVFDYELFDFGARVDAEPPPAATVVDAVGGSV